jgi:hypothetical protein
MSSGTAQDGKGKSGSLVENYLEAAETNLNLTLSGYTAAQENYRKSSDTYVKVQVQVASIMDELASLISNEVSPVSQI